MPTTFTAGITSTASNNQVYVDQTNFSQIASQITMTESGSVQSISVYVSAGISNVEHMKLGLWNSSGQLVASSGQFTAAPASGAGVNQQTWQTQDVSPTTILAGTYYVGFWADPANYREYSTQSGAGTTWKLSEGAAPNITNFTGKGITTVTEQLSAYITYIKAGGIKVYAGSFARHPVKTWNGSAWVWHPVYVWNGSAWVHNG